VVVDFDLDEVGPADLGARGQAAHDGEMAETELAHHAGDDDEGEQHAEQEIQQVVAGIDGGKADAKCYGDEVLALAGELEPARWAQTMAGAAPEAGGRGKGLH
jgi:hypothetical protein